MADKRISQLIERTDIANNDVLPIVASGATTTNKVTVSTLQDWMQDNLDVGVTSVGLSMPSAFTVSNSPVTTSGNISVVGAGTVSQYIRGDGSLADFPQGGGGGGSSVSYYLNGSVSQGTIGGIAYLEMSKVPILGTGTDFTINADGYIASFITDAGDPALLLIPGGNWNLETYFQASSAGGTPSFYVELYKVDSGGTATLIASNSANPELIAFGTTTTAYFSSLAVPTTTLTLTDRLALRYYVTHAGRTITLHTENSNLCQIITTFTTGLTALNGLTAQVQNLATGTSGTDFNIVSSTSTHTFNLPNASATARGVVSTGTQTFAGAKTFNSSVTASSLIRTGGTSSQFLKADGSVDSNSYALNSSLSLYLPLSGGTMTGILNVGSGNLRIASEGTSNPTILRNFTGTAQGQSSFNNIGFNNSNNLYFTKNLNNGCIFSFNNTAYRTYTFPDVDATIASTSDLGAYLPLTGGTLSNNLFITGGGLQVSGSTSANRQVAELYTSGSVSRLAASYVGASSYGSLELLTSGLARLTIADTGAVTLTGALNGTEINASMPSGNGALYIKNSSLSSKNWTFIPSTNAGETDLLFFYTGVGAGTKLTLASTGVATFSSSVTANGVMSLGNDGTFGSTYKTLGLTGNTTGSHRIFAGTADDMYFAAATGRGFEFRVNGGGVGNLNINSNGNVGINTPSPSAKLHVNNGTNLNVAFNTTTVDSVTTSRIISFNDAVTATVGLAINGTPLVFQTEATERMRITSGGFLKASNTGSYWWPANNFHTIENSIADWTCAIANTNSVSPSGVLISYNLAIPNNFSNNFIFAADQVATRFVAYSNGGIGNYQANNLNLSDERTKKDIEPLESYWDKFKAIEIVKFKYKDQTHDDYNIGVIAQQVEAVAPEFVDVDGWGVKPELDEEGNEIVSEEEPLKSIYTADLHHATIKVLQEAMAKIEKLETEIDSLKK